MNRLAALLSLLGIAWLTLWGCGVVLPNAPMSAVNPRGAYDIGENQFEANVGASGGFNPYAYEASGVGACSAGVNRYGSEDCAILPELGFTYLHHFNDHFAIGGQAHYAYNQTLPGMGGLLRGTWLTTDRVRWGGDLGWGFFYVSLATPFAVKVADPLWIYTAPSVELSAFPRAWVPLGASLDVNDHVALDLQVHAQLATLGYTNVPTPFGYGAFFGVDARF